MSLRPRPASVLKQATSQHTHSIASVSGVCSRASNEPLRSLKLYNHEEGPYWLKAATTAFTFKNL